MNPLLPPSGSSGDGPAPPRVAAIVIADRPRGFLSDALASAEAALARLGTPVERILVAPAGLVPPSGWTGVPAEVGSPVGGKLAAAVGASRAELLAFLEDDDRWRPTHLERAEAALRARPRAVLFQDRSCRIDGAGWPERGRAGADGARRDGEPEIVCAPWDPLQLRRARLGTLGTELSSFVVPRRVLLGAASLLGGIRAAPDRAVLYLALARGSEVLAGRSVGTERRIHGGNLSEPVAREGGADAGAALEQYGREVVSDLERIEAFLDRGDPSAAAVAPLVRAEAAFQRLVGCLRRPGIDRATWGRSWSAARRARGALSLGFGGGALALGALGVASPRLAQGLYWWIRPRRAGGRTNPGRGPKLS